jgi:hypothetical protein
MNQGAPSELSLQSWLLILDMSKAEKMMARDSFNG